MGHDVRNFIGVQKRELVKSVKKVAPDYMAMGSAGMADMGEMEMPLPDNTLPMMTGFGQYGPLEMGGMFTVVKVREGLKRNDYADPGWFKHPAGTVAYEVADDAGPRPVRPEPAPNARSDRNLKVIKPTGSHKGH